MIARKIKHWYVPAILGALLLILGFWMIANPESGFATLTALFQWALVIYGILEIIFSITIRLISKDWGWYFISGLISLFLGIYLFKNPVLSEVTFAMYVGFLALYYACTGLGKAMYLFTFNIPGSGWLILLGIFGLFFSFVLIWNPNAAGLTAVLWTAIILITKGIFGVALSFKLKSLGD